jgi:tetratricopeptide (TPR) repeat protein
MFPEQPGLSRPETNEPDASGPAADERPDSARLASRVRRLMWCWTLGAVLLVGLAGFSLVAWVVRSFSYAASQQATSVAVPADVASQSLESNPDAPRSETHVFSSQADANALSDLPDPATPLPETHQEIVAEAHRVAKYVVQCFPSDPDALEVLARYEKWLGNTAEAVAVWDRCLDLNPNYGYAYFGKAMVAAQRGDNEEAAQLFGKALERKSDWPEAELELARALINADRSQDAIPVLEKHVQRKPFLSEAYALLGQAYSQCGEFQRAKTSYEISVRILPSHTNAYYGLATAHTRLGEHQQAREMMEQFRERKAADFTARKTEKNEYDDLEAMRIDSAVVYLNAGQIYYARGRLAEAERLWRRAAALHPAYVECHQALAWLYRSNGHLPQAIEMLEQLARIEPDNPLYLDEIARLHIELGQMVETELPRQRLPKQGELR